MKVLVPAATFHDLAPTAAQIATPDKLQLIPYTEEEGTEEADAHAVFRWVAGKRYESLVLERPSVCWLQTASAGIDHVLTPALRERGGFVLTDSGPAFGICIGEFVLAWMLAVAHHLPGFLVQREQKQWKAIQQEELYGQTVGIIGLGPIGQAVATRCKAMGMTTLGLRRTNAPVPDVDVVLTGKNGLSTLLSNSDWIVIAAALTDQTRALVGAEQLACMKDGVRIVNIARGALIEEKALINALRNGKVGAACLDVFDREPLPHESPLWTLPNVYVTPHNSPGWTAGLRRRQLDPFLTNLHHFYHGEPLENAVDFERGY